MGTFEIILIVWLATGLTFWLIPMFHDGLYQKPIIIFLALLWALALGPTLLLVYLGYKVRELEKK